MRGTICALAAALALAACGGGADDKVGNAFLNGSARIEAAPTGEQYVALFAGAGVYVMQAAEMALEKSDSAELRGLAQMILSDHQRLSNDLAAAGLEVHPPHVPSPVLDAEQQAGMNRLSATPSAAFDRAWLEQQIRAHERALDTAIAYSRNGDSPALRRHAASTIAPMQTHLTRARRLEAEARARR